MSGVCSGDLQLMLLKPTAKYEDKDQEESSQGSCSARSHGKGAFQVPTGWGSKGGGQSAQIRQRHWYEMDFSGPCVPHFGN